MGQAGEAEAAPPARATRETMWAWERFLTGQLDMAFSLGSVVVSSWRRSLALGVDATGRAAPIAATGDLLLARRQRHQDLLNAAADLFARMRDVLEGTHCMMLLTDPDGVVLETVGDHRTLAAGERIHLIPGGHWCESVIGTNGIGTALATGQPAQVHAAEHFCEGIKSWTCAAAPVREPVTGRLLGIVDISGPPSTYQRGNLSLAVATARQLETALAAQAGRERVRLLEHCLQRLPAAANVTVVDRAGRVVFANGGETPQGLPAFDPQQTLKGWTAQLPESLMSGADVDAVELEGRTIGAMIVRPQRSAYRRNLAPEAFAGIVGDSPAVQLMIAQTRPLAAKPVPLLIEGETGVGKEQLVRAIHALAGPQAPLITFNCGVASKEMLAGELFGHVRGAFTGALQEGRPSRFELAKGGILCLDEIGELPIDFQPLLLRALEERVVYRLGDPNPRPTDFRLITMTNRNLQAEVAAGRFRADLYYRIAVTKVTVPPLRARAGDVDLLLTHFLARHAARYQLPRREISAAARAVLCAYSWPGNIRELSNLVEFLTLTGDGAVIEPGDLPPEFTAAAGQSPDMGAPDTTRLDEAGQRLIRRTIQDAGGNLSEAARRLGIARTTLHRRLGRINLEAHPTRP